jgi:hypothetical protein
MTNFQKREISPSGMPDKFSKEMIIFFLSCRPTGEILNFQNIKIHHSVRDDKFSKERDFSLWHA